MNQAKQRNIPIVVLGEQFSFLQYSSDEQIALVNNAIIDALPNIVEGYNGFVTTDYYNPDERFTWLASEHIDWIGDKWFPSIATTKKPQMAEMVTAARTFINERYLPAYERFGKPIFFNQLAFHGWDGAAGPLSTLDSEGEQLSEYYKNNTKYPKDYQEQARAYEAVFRAIAETDYIIGAFSFSYTYYQHYDKSANVRGKPAERVWMRWNGLLN